MKPEPQTRTATVSLDVFEMDGKQSFTVTLRADGVLFAGTVCDDEHEICTVDLYDGKALLMIPDHENGTARTGDHLHEHELGHVFPDYQREETYSALDAIEAREKRIEQARERAWDREST